MTVTTVIKQGLKRRSSKSSFTHDKIMTKSSFTHDIHVSWLYYGDIKIRETFVYKHILTPYSSSIAPPLTVNGQFTQVALKIISILNAAFLQILEYGLTVKDEVQKISTAPFVPKTILELQNQQTREQYNDGDSIADTLFAVNQHV